MTDPSVPFAQTEGMRNVINEKDRFECDFELPRVRAEEIDLKIVRDELVVNCKEGDRREFRFRLPGDLDPSTIETKLREEGVLNLRARKRH